jgi:competence ComEA-like helix-hairpin-helix protein
MVPKIHSNADDINRSRSFDPRIVLLLTISLAIVLNTLLFNRQPQDLSSPSGQHKLQWSNNSLSLTTGETHIDHIPAHIAPFYFEKININQANSALLQIIPGIGPDLADRIIVKRNEKGGFDRPEELLTVPGIGPKRKEKLSAWLSFD